jgi:hypothetical protein
MEFIANALDFGKELFAGGTQAVGSLLGGSAGGMAAKAATDWLLGEDDEKGGDAAVKAAGGAAAQSFGLGGGTSGPGGAGMSFQQGPASGNPPINMGSPNQPGGGLQGPVYGTQGLDQLAPILKNVLTTLAANPQLGQLVQRYWDFPRGEVKKNQHQQLAWALMAKQLPQHMRHALEQFTLGLCAPMGLTQSGEDAFKLLTIAEAGYEPTAIGLCAFDQG